MRKYLAVVFPQQDCEKGHKIQLRRLPASWSPPIILLAAFLPQLGLTLCPLWGREGGFVFEKRNTCGFVFHWNIAHVSHSARQYKQLNSPVFLFCCVCTLYAWNKWCRLSSVVCTTRVCRPHSQFIFSHMLSPPNHKNNYSTTEKKK